MHLHKPLRNKLEPRALRCVFVGYALHQKGYRCYHPPSRKIYVTLDVVFHEKDMYYSTSESPLQGENRDEVQTLHHPLDLDLISGDNLDTSGECDHLETNDECPSDGDTVTNRGGCPDGQQFLENEVQDQMEVLSVSSSSHDVPANQLSSPADSMPKPQVNYESKPHLKMLPDQVTRG